MPSTFQYIESELLKKSGDLPKRDQESGAVYYDYLDEEKQTHTVWYADEITLAQWIDRSKQAGYKKIALWRAGGFEQKTLTYFKESKWIDDEASGQ